MNPARKKERRQLNAKVNRERRSSTMDRRRCPDCGGLLATEKKRLAGGSVSVSTCKTCGWARSQRQVDADVLTLKLTWGLSLEPHAGGLAAVLPPELEQALGVRKGDELVISPLTSPLGSQAMKWSLSLNRRR